MVSLTPFFFSDEGNFSKNAKFGFHDGDLGIDIIPEVRFENTAFVKRGVIFLKEDEYKSYLKNDWTYEKWIE